MLKGQRTIFSLAHILQIGLFPHIRVTKFPPHLETKVPLAFASPDAWVSPSQWHSDLKEALFFSLYSSLRQFHSAFC